MDLFRFFFVAYRQPGPCPVDPVIYLLNMDTQDGQDKKNEKLVRGKRAGSLIECSFEVIHDHGDGCWNPW